MIYNDLYYTNPNNFKMRSIKYMKTTMEVGKQTLRNNTLYNNNKYKII